MNGLIQLPGGAYGFIDGGKPDHECNSDGAIIMLRNGERVEDTEENREKYYDQASGGSVVCTICGQAAIDRAMWDFWE